MLRESSAKLISETDILQQTADREYSRFKSMHNIQNVESYEAN
jgi:hypothetical protein